MKKLLFTMLMLASFMTQALGFSTDNTLSVWMDQKVELTADGQTVTYLTIYEYDPNVNYISFNMAIFVPKGTKIHQRKEGRKYVNDIDLNADRKTDHTIACGMPDDHTVKIIAYSMTNDQLYPDKEDGTIVKELLTIGLVSENTAINGTYRAEMLDVNFTYRDASSKITSNGIDHIEYADFTVTGGQDFPGIDYTMSPARYGTLILPFNSEIPKGLTAYECKGVDEENMLVLDAVSSFSANTPYVVKGEPATYHFNGVYSALFDEYSTEYMTGVYTDRQVPTGAYVLQNQETDGLAFYRVYDTPVINITPYRCYINKPTATQAANCLMLPDKPTGIATADIDSNKLVDVYNASGMRVKSKVRTDKALEGLPSGVYIINNNKVIKK